MEPPSTQGELERILSEAGVDPTIGVNILGAGQDGPNNHSQFARWVSQIWTTIGTSCWGIHLNFHFSKKHASELLG